MSIHSIRPGLRAASGDDRPDPAPQPPPRSPWPDPPQVPPSGPGHRVAPDVDLHDEYWRDAQPMRYPGHARIIDRDPARPGVYTVLLDRCLCGAVVGECDCAGFANTAAWAPVYVLPARQTYRVEFDRIGQARRVPSLTATAATDGELVVRVDRYLRPFFGHDIEVSLSSAVGTGRVLDHGVPAGRLTVAVVTR